MSKFQNAVVASCSIFMTGTYVSPSLKFEKQRTSLRNELSHSAVKLVKTSVWHLDFSFFSVSMFQKVEAECQINNVILNARINLTRQKDGNRNVIFPEFFLQWNFEA